MSCNACPPWNATANSSSLHTRLHVLDRIPENIRYLRITKGINTGRLQHFSLAKSKLSIPPTRFAVSIHTHSIHLLFPILTNHSHSHPIMPGILSRPQATVDVHSQATCINHLLQCGPLSWTLNAYDVHGYAGGTCTIDIHVAGGLWALILRIARAILQAAYPGRDVRQIMPFIHPSLLDEIAMASPPIIDALGFTQNPCLISGSHAEIEAQFKGLQRFGIEGLKWLLDARARCAIFTTRWSWPHATNETFPTVPFISTQPSPAQIEPLELPLLALPQPTNTERSLILHPIHSTNASSGLMVHPTMSNALRPFRDDSPYDPYSPYFNPAPTPSPSNVCTYNNSRATSPTDSVCDQGSSDEDGDFEMFKLDDFSSVNQYGEVVYDLTSPEADFFMEEV